MSDAEVHAAVARFVDAHYPIGQQQHDKLEQRCATTWEWADELAVRETQGEDFGKHGADAVAGFRFQQWAMFDALALVLGEDWMAGHEDAVTWPLTDLPLALQDDHTWGIMGEQRMMLVRAGLSLGAI